MEQYQARLLKLVLNILEAVNTADCNTRRQCEILQEKLKGWEGQIIIYGDASNQRRTESADVNITNWIIVKMYFPGIRKNYLQSAFS